MGRFERYLRRLGVLDDATAERMRGDAAELMRRGIAQAEAEPPGEVEQIFAPAYASPPPELAADLAELKRLTGR